MAQSLLKKVNRAGYIVKDIEKAISRFSELYNISEWEYSQCVQSGGQVKIAVSLPKEGTQIEIMMPIGNLPIPIYDTQALRYIGFVSSQYEEDVEAFQLAGAKCIVDLAAKDNPRRSFVYDSKASMMFEIAEDIRQDRQAASTGIQTLLTSLGIRHIGYMVSDRDAAVAHLEATYGISDWTFIEYKPIKAWCNGQPYEGQYHVRVAALPRMDGCVYEINEAVSGGIHSDMYRNQKESINHMCHMVKDFDKYRDHFAALGCQIIFASEMEDDILGYRRCVYLRDPVINMIIELAEKPYFRK